MKKCILIFVFTILVFCFTPLYAHDKNPIIKFYQKHISAVDGNRCPMYPSCSEYANQAFQKHGFFIGWIMSCDRLVRCGRDEADIAWKIIINNDKSIYDPLEANNFWWFEKDQEK